MISFTYGILKSQIIETKENGDFQGLGRGENREATVKGYKVSVMQNK